MTFNEFKMCCILFCKAFEGKKYGEIIEGCYYEYSNLIIPKTPIVIKRNFVLDGAYIWIFNTNDVSLYILITGSNISNFKTLEDFLNYFKIHLEDIV